MRTALSILGSIFVSVSCFAESTYNLSYANNPPFTNIEDGKEKGVAIDIVNALFKKAKISLKYTNEPLARAMMTAKNDVKGCVFPVQRAQDIEAEYQWVSPILITQSTLLASPDFKTPIETLADAKKLSIGVLLGSGDADYLKKFGYKVEEAPTQEQNLEKLKAKRIDMWAADNLSANYFTKKSGDKDSLKKVMVFRKSLGSLACNNAVPKADIEKLQETLNAMIKDGSLEKMTSK